jgi:hypothetical protein
VGYSRTGSPLVAAESLPFPWPESARPEDVAGDWVDFSVQRDDKKAGFVTVTCRLKCPPAPDLLKLMQVRWQDEAAAIQRLDAATADLEKEKEECRKRIRSLPEYKSLERSKQDRYVEDNLKKAMDESPVAKKMRKAIDTAQSNVDLFGPKVAAAIDDTNKALEAAEEVVKGVPPLRVTDPWGRMLASYRLLFMHGDPLKVKGPKPDGLNAGAE